MRQNQKNGIFAASWVIDVLNTALPDQFNQLGTHEADSVHFTAITTDSRAVTEGCLFAALKGQTSDGHAFIEDAIRKGAAGILYENSEFTLTPSQKNPLLFRVPNTRDAYRALAFAWRREFKIPVLAVTGSMGKTTTKEMIAAMVQGKFKEFLKTEASQNGFDGIPMTLLKLRPEHKIAVIEIGIDEPGAMIQHLDLVAPTHSILTAIGPEHLLTLGSIETVAQEEGLSLSEVYKNGGTAIVNLDDPHIHLDPSLLGSEGGKAFYFSLQEGETKKKASSETTLVATRTHQTNSLQEEIRVTGIGLNHALFQVPVAGHHNARNFTGALCAALALGLTESEIRNGLSHFEAPTGRSQVMQLPGGIQVLCDYYNANPPSMVAGFQTVQEMHRIRSNAEKTGGRTWICLADMRELGPGEVAFHKGLAPELIKKNFDFILLFGPLMKSLHDELVSFKYQGFMKYFDEKKDLSSYLTSQARAGDTILIKGSRGMRMEEVWKALLDFFKK
ncbi:MAG: UDP-N-acetylmuramoyl-tripeptide--D-alanyl-D-alanine ligase [Bdellovibrio sp.]|nr:UDP-N-acetylmuramoyl-tripeptide--D-alanyl-D-alanine ligase [Bdellovibrio sp.]